jgi:hypothetical protein
MIFATMPRLNLAMAGSNLFTITTGTGDKNIEKGVYMGPKFGPITTQGIKIIYQEVFTNELF